MGRTAGQYIEVCIKNVTINTGIEGHPPDFLKSKVLAVSLKSLDNQKTHTTLCTTGKKDKNAENNKNLKKYLN